MAVVVEVPAGCKFCRDCGEVKPIEGNFHMRLHKGKRKPQPYCTQCMRLRWHRWNIKARGEPQQAKARVWVRPAYEASCDAAFVGWRGPVSGSLLGARL